MGKKVYVSVNALSEGAKEKVKKVIIAVSDSYTRMDAEKDLIKDALNTISEETGVQKKILRKMARTYHKASFNEETEEFETFENMYESILNE
ncbi:MAG: hypothetical protein WD512_01200 [Candidatus Paceibacterota bacterium]